MNLILFGFKGCGKTTLGTSFARILDCPFLDTDEILEKKFGIPVSSLFQTLGSERFREEENVVVRGLSGTKGSIIAVGGGTVLNPENVKVLTSLGALVYLRASFELVLERTLRGSPPSFIDPENIKGSLQKIYEERVPLYESIDRVCVITV